MAPESFDLPVPVFRRIGLRLEGNWSRGRILAALVSLVAVAAFYLGKKLHPQLPLSPWIAFPPVYLLVAVLGYRAARRIMGSWRAGLVSGLSFVALPRVLPEA